MSNQLFVGQPEALLFSSFNQRATPEVDGEVSLISADLNRTNRTGISYYAVRIIPKPDGFAQLGDKIIPRIPVDASFKRASIRTITARGEFR